MRKRWGKIIGIIVLLCLLVGVALFFIDEPLRLYAERQFNRHVVGYTLAIGRLRFHPIGLSVDFENATLVQNELPAFTSIERIVSKRKGKMYIDFLQNRPQATVSAPYSLRPKPGATVSMPLYWEEVKKGLKMADFNIYNALDRIKSEGDIFKPVLGKGINLEKVISSFTK